MKSSDAAADVFLTALKSLPKAERDAVLVGIARDRSLRRDLLDLALIENRRGEPSRDFRTYLEQRDGE